MISVAKVQRRNAWRYYVRGVAFGDGRRPAGQALKDAQPIAGLPPGVWRGRGLAALGLTAGQRVTERELPFGESRHPDADRMERKLLDDGEDPAAARLATVLGQPIEEIEQRKQTPLLALDFVFRPQASPVVLWALGDARTRRVIEQAHKRAVTKTLRWLEDEVAATWWASGRQRAKAPALVVAAFRHFDNRNGFTLLHEHCLILNRVQRPDGSWYALDTVRLYKRIVAADALYTLEMTTEVCEKLGLATVPREVTPGLRPVMEIAGVGQELIDWSSTRRRRIEDVLKGITDEYVKKHGHLPGERVRHGLAWWAAQETRPDKKTPRPLDQLLARWRVSTLLKFGQRMVDGLLQRCQAAGAAIRARPWVDTALATVGIAAVVFMVRGIFSRRHVLAEARRHLMETLRGRAYVPGIDSHIADRALERYGRQLTVPQKGRRIPASDQLSYTADFAWPIRWWIAGTDGKPPRESSRYERARVTRLALQNAIRAALTAPTAVRDEAPAATTSAAPHAVDHRAGTPLELRRSGPLPSRRTSRPRSRRSTWRAARRPPRRGRPRRRPRPYRRDHLRGRGPRPHSRKAGRPDEAGEPGPGRRPGQPAAAPGAAGPG
ncbi:UNVERIFIED_CONTAM: conjugative relaxase-like TrwC/TraI family protein [Streptomyces canus]